MPPYAKKKEKNKKKENIKTHYKFLRGKNVSDSSLHPACSTKLLQYQFGI